MAKPREVGISWDRSINRLSIRDWNTGEVVHAEDAYTLTQALTAIGVALNGSAMTAKPLEVVKLEVVG